MGYSIGRRSGTQEPEGSHLLVTSVWERLLADVVLDLLSIRTDTVVRIVNLVY